MYIQGYLGEESPEIHLSSVFISPYQIVSANKHKRTFSNLRRNSEFSVQFKEHKKVLASDIKVIYIYIYITAINFHI